jgi:hypothetical protein
MQYKCLCLFRLNDGRTRYFQNWQREDKGILSFRGKKYQYLPFPIPPLKREIGENASTISLELPNIGSSEFGYLPIRDWAQEKYIENALIRFEIFDGSNIITRHNFCVAERILKGNTIELRLRQPDDGFVRIMTGVYSYKDVGETPNYSAFG